MQQWRLLDSEPADAYTNMALDEALLLAQVNGENIPPTLRFYSWQPAAISLGYSQNMDEVIDKKACQRAGIDIVRRATGGRAVYHNKELTYCLAVQADNPLFAGSVRESYATISKGLLAGLQILGINAQFASYRHLRKKKPEIRQSSICFLTPSWYEIMVDGKKLVGSAQRRLKGIILQQGAILLENENAFFNYCKLSDNQAANLRNHWTKKATALWELIEQRSLVEVKQALIRGFEQTLPIKLVPGKLTAAEKELTKKLLDKYRSPQWNNRNEQVRN